MKCDVGAISTGERWNKGNRGIKWSKRKEEEELEHLSEFGMENWHKSFEKQIIFS